MYMFDLNRPPILCMIGGRFRSNMYIAVSHTNRRPIKNTIGVVKNRLVGMALYNVISVIFKYYKYDCDIKQGSIRVLYSHTCI